MMNFQFVDNSAIDAVARKRIRRQVMIGKNAGKKRSRPEKPAKSPSVLTSKSSSSTDRESSSESDDALKMLFPMPRQTFHEFDSLSWPGELGASERNLVRQFIYITSDVIYPRELCVNPTIAFRMWMEWFQTSEAVFHCLLAMAEGQKLLLLGQHDWTPRLVQSLASTYRAINENLKSDDLPTDATVATVMSITMHENLMGAPKRAKIHLEALERMVKMRGGLTGIQSSRALQQKVMRTDLEYALQTGERPRFLYDEFPRHVLGDSRALTPSIFSGVENIELQDILDDFLSASQILNDWESGPNVEPYSFQDILITSSYRLLHLCPLADEDSLNAIDEAYHLGMVALIASMFIRYRHGPQGTPYYLIADRLRKAVSRLSIEPGNSELTVWLLFAGGVFVLNPLVDVWVYPQVRTCLSSLGLDNWRDVQKTLLNYPWIRFFHDLPGQDLYTKAMLTA